MALGAFGVWVLMRIKGLPFAPLADALAPGVILAQAIGRLGNWFNQELYGAPTDVPWALDIYYRVDEHGNYSPLNGRSTGEVIASVHPTFLYELIWNVLVFAVLIWADRKFRLGHGRVVWLYVAGYTFGRFFIELMRTDDANTILGLRVNTWVSGILFIVGVVMFLRTPKGRETPAEVDPAFNASREAFSASGDGENRYGGRVENEPAGSHEPPTETRLKRRG